MDQQQPSPWHIFFRSLNLPLLIGVLTVGTLACIALFGPLLAPHDPIQTHSILELPNGEFVVPPFSPGDVPGFPLGSDLDGRDVYSRLLWAVRPTLILALLTSLIRLVIGTLLGLFEGWYGGILGDAISGLTRVALGIPILVVAISVVYILGYRYEAWVFIIALSLTGWGATTKMISERTRQVRSQPFIEASRALGAGNLRLLWNHVLPQVRTLLSVLWAFEMASILLQLAELGFLGFFIGGGAIRLVPDPNSPTFISQIIAGMPELGQMLSSGWDNFLYSPWIALVAGTSFFFAIFSFMALGEGLKRFFAKTSGPLPVRALFFFNRSALIRRDQSDDGLVKRWRPDELTP